ncbi:hypothetical protein [Ottowia thiooxydans]|uniref:Uncharacterized protein n=1 Tax=Ottowia thiooxydans TaxID=219182 RepID=A0ABV2QBT1_9BURK
MKISSVVGFRKLWLPSLGEAAQALNRKLHLAPDMQASVRAQDGA